MVNKLEIKIVGAVQIMGSMAFRVVAGGLGVC